MRVPASTSDKSFSDALVTIRRGGKARRLNMDGFISIFHNEGTNRDEVHHTWNDQHRIWQPCQRDMLTDDWEVYEL
jgi:hypothetical protein